MGDAAVVPLPNGAGRLAFTTDGFVVQPAFFPGSNIGELAVNGTVNDLAMMGAEPLALSAALILEEGLSMERLGGVIASMADACERAGVRLVTGDTKVVERGAADGLYITTSGIGLIPDGVEVGPERCRPGDVIIVTGPVGSHGVAVMSRRAGIDFEADVRSDTAPLTGLVRAMLAAGDVRCLRDATRGGLASVLNELAQASRVSMTITETRRARAARGEGGERDARSRPAVRGQRGCRGGDRGTRRAPRRCVAAARADELGAHALDRRRGRGAARRGASEERPRRDPPADHAGRRSAPAHLLTKPRGRGSVPSVGPGSSPVVVSAGGTEPRPRPR